MIGSVGTLMVGISLEEERGQICCYCPLEKAPISICTDEEKKEYEIPAWIYRDPVTGEWYIGRKAFDMAIGNGDEVIEGFLCNYSDESSVLVNDEEYKKKDLLKKFIENLLDMLKTYDAKAVPEYVSFSVEMPGNKIRKDLKAITRSLGIQEKNIAIISRKQAYAHYALGQGEELWRNGAGLFDYDQSGLHYYELNIKRRNPFIVDVAHKDLTHFIGGDDHKIKDSELLDKSFTSVIESLHVMGRVSAFYLVGQGFDHKWHSGSTDMLCARNRVFAGQSLYAMGACYHSIGMADEAYGDRFVILDDDVCTRDVSLYLYGQEGYYYQPLCKIGDRFEEVSVSLNVILCESKTFHFKVFDPITRDEKYVDIELNGLKQVNKFSGCIEVKIAMESPTVMTVKLKDKGFGMFLDSAGMTWNKRVNVTDAQYGSDFTLFGRIIKTTDGELSIPYHFSLSRVKVYTFEQLCYYIHDNIYSLDNSFFQDELFIWIANYGKRPRVGADLQKMKETGYTMSDLIVRILKYSLMYSDKEIAKIKAIVESIEQKNPTELKKVKADNYLRYEQYKSAISIYLSILYELEENVGMKTRLSDDFAALVYHNLGSAFAGMLDFSSAADAFIKAYEISNSNDSLKCYIWALKAGGDQKKLKEVMVKYHLADDTLRVLINRFNDVSLLEKNTVDEIKNNLDDYINNLKEEYR